MDTEHPRENTAHGATEPGLSGFALILDTVIRVSQFTPPCKDVEELRHLAGAMCELTGARRVVLGIVRGHGEGFSHVLTTGFPPEKQAAIEAPHSPERESAEAVLSLLLERDDPFRLTSAPLEGEGDSFLGMALHCGAVVTGALYMTGKTGGEAFSQTDQGYAQGLAVHVAYAIYNLQMLGREQALVAGLLNAHEEERRAIAYDLHDGLTQSVLAAQIFLEAFEHSQTSGDTQKAAHELGQATQLLQKSVTESRRLINGLRSLILDDLGLCSALDGLLHEEGELAGWSDVEFRCNLGPQRFGETLETAVYRVAQEALTNVRRHAQSQWVKVVCERDIKAQTGEMCLRLEVSDGGRGFDSQAHARSLAARGGIGLLSMNERTRMLGGQFESKSVPGEGTQVLACFPLSQATEASSDDA